MVFQTDNEESANYNHMKEKLKDEISKEFKPEFVNRIDDIVIFKSLVDNDLVKITKILVKDMTQRLKEKNIRIKVDEKVIKFITEKGTNTRMGARPLRRALQEHLEDPLSDAVLKRNAKSDLSVNCHVTKDKKTKEEKVSFNIRKLKPKVNKSIKLSPKSLMNATS